MRTYSSIEAEFRQEFSEESNFSWCDFRPRINGNLINASLAIPPARPIQNTEARAWEEFRRMWNWLRNWKDYFDNEDWLQVVIGFNVEVRPTGGRQIFKGIMAVKDISKLPPDFDIDTFNRCDGQCRLLVNWEALSKLSDQGTGGL